MSLTAWAIRNSRPIVFLTAVLCLIGAVIYGSLPVSILPDVTFPRVVVIASAGDRPTKNVEISIARPIEEAVAIIPGVSRVRSTTQRGSTEISIDFAPSTDIVAAEQFVNAKVNEVRPLIPPETETEVERMNATVFPVVGLTLNSKSLSQTELWSLAQYTLRPRLSRVPGVARVVVQGGRPPEIAVTVRPAALAAFGLSTADVVQAITATNAVHAVGRLDRRFQQFQVTVSGEITSPKQIGEIVVAQKSGTPIRVRQVADVSDSTEDRTTVVSANGSESVLLNLIRQPSANSVAMVEAVKAELKTLQSQLPADVKVATFYDQSVLIRDAVGSVRDAVVIGAVLSVVVLMLFLGNVRATLVTAAIIPTTLLITFILMKVSGLTLNLMTLGALAVGIGLVIDDAIVVVESVFQNMEGSESVAEAVRRAASQIAAPMVSSTLTTVVVFLPLSFLEGVAGAFFSALALTLSIALMVSLVLALCVSPTLCATFLRPGVGKEGSIFRGFLHGYVQVLRGLLRRKWMVVPIVAATLFGIWSLASKLETGFMPAMDEGAFVLDYLTPPGTSLTESDRLLQKIDQVLLSTPEISTFSRRTGTELGFSITESNRGDYAVMLKDGSRKNIEDVMADVRSRVQEQVPGMDVEFIQVLQDLIGDLAGNPNPIEVKLFGEDKPQVEAIATDLAERLGKVKGLVDLKSGLVESGPEVRLELDPGITGRLGMTTESVTAQANAAMLGTVATQVLSGDRQIPVRVRLPLGARSTLEEIQDIGIQTLSGRVRLKDFGKIELVPGVTQSSREDQRRVVSVTAGLEGVDLGTAVAGVQKALAETKLPPGVSAEIAGQFRSQQDSFRNLESVLGAAVLLVFVVMLFQFRSFRAPLVILILMPLSLFGAVVGLWTTHTALNVSSFMGVVMLAGIVVKNGILLLDRAQTSIELGSTVEDALVEAGEHRLRPILMTTLTAILGLLPLAMGLGAGAEMQKPLAVAVVGGLAFSTFLTLLVGPVLYASFGKAK